jgi:hypothetical protein
VEWIEEARNRVHALPNRPDDVAVAVQVDVRAWARRWHLEGLADIAPSIAAYWTRRPAAGSRLWFPRLRPMTPRPEIDPALDPDDPAQPLLAAPEFGETQEQFLARAKQHFQRRASGVRRPRQLQRHAEWFVMTRVQGWSDARAAGAATTAARTPEVSTIRKGVAEFVRLLSAPSIEGN